MARKAISASVRWQVFARDGFRCRYCGVQAGVDGTVLQAEHVVSVADGGANVMDNLVAACQRCNNGKHARSLDEVPGSQAAIDHATAQATTLRAQARAITTENETREEFNQRVVSLVQEAYDVDRFHMCNNHMGQLRNLVRKYGPSRVRDWLEISALNGVSTSSCLPYIYGIIRRLQGERRA